MQIRIATIHNPTGDEDTSLLSDDDNTLDEDSIGNEMTKSTPHDNPTDTDQIPNLIQTPDRLIPLRNCILTTLQPWILPGNIPRIPPLPNPPNTHNPGNLMTQCNCYLQQSLEAETSNNHWGDPVPTLKPLNTFCLLSKNMNMLSTTTDYLPWKAASHAIAETNADSTVFQETNLSWNELHRRKIKQILKGPIRQAVITTASSRKISLSSHQPSGTLQAIVGNWAIQVVQKGTDTTGLGCWSFIES